MILVMGIFFLGLVLAQEIATDEDIKIAGITPDSVFYPLEIAFEKIIELFSENSKLNHAVERLAEVKVMIDKNKLASAEKAREEFEKIRLTMKNKSIIEEHKILMDNLGLKIKEIASGTNNLTEENRMEIIKLINNSRENIFNEKVKIGKLVSIRRY